MGSLFGKHKKPASRITEHDKAVLQLKQQRDKIKQHQKKVELNLERDRQLAKTLLDKGQRDRAKVLLRKKKYQEKVLETTDKLLENLEQLTQDLEFAQVEVRVLEGLKNGNEALRKVNETLNIDEIEKILEDTKEGIDKQREIDELLSGQLTEEDEEAVEAELEAILDVKDQLPDVPLEDLPEVPVEKVPEKPQKVKESPKKIAVEA